MIRLYIAAGGVIAVLLALLYIGHLRSELKDAKEAEAAATRQAHTAEATTQAADVAHRTEVIIRDRTERRVDAVQAAPGADDPVPTAVLDAWRSALGELRDHKPEALRQGS